MNFIRRLAEYCIKICTIVFGGTYIANIWFTPETRIFMIIPIAIGVLWVVIPTMLDMHHEFMMKVIDEEFSKLEKKWLPNKEGTKHEIH